jgi:hypothetical protein
VKCGQEIICVYGNRRFIAMNGLKVKTEITVKKGIGEKGGNGELLVSTLTI